MMRIKKLSGKIKNLLDFSNQFYQELLGYKPEQISLKQIPENQWNEFATQRGLNPNSSGIYLPRNQTAVVRDETPLSLFHEYFGHGLYCEQSLSGRRLVDLEKRLLEEEIREFQNKKFSLDELHEFRNQNQTFQELKNLRKENLGRYELFAIWTEYLLSKENGLKNLFERKYDSLSGQEKEAVDQIINFSSQYGNLSTMYSQGMARRTTPERVKRLLEDVYRDKLQGVKFALLYGSKKEFSDIDVFMVGDRAPNEAHSDWLDVKYKSRKEFNQGLKNFDVRILIPLTSGEFVFGDKNYFEKLKQQVLSQPITEKAIKHNLKWFSRMQRLRDENLQDDFLRKKFEGYSKTYLANAFALKEGKRLFTKEDLLSYSQQEKLIELKGGTEKDAT